jgi:hypothetical protein
MPSALQLLRARATRQLTPRSVPGLEQPEGVTLDDERPSLFPPDVALAWEQDWTLEHLQEAVDNTAQFKVCCCCRHRLTCQFFQALQRPPTFFQLFFALVMVILARAMFFRRHPLKCGCNPA